MLIIDRRNILYIPRNKNIYKTHFKLAKLNPIKTKNKEDPFQFMLILDREREGAKIAKYHLFLEIFSKKTLFRK